MNKINSGFKRIGWRIFLVAMLLPLVIAALPVSSVSAALRSCRGDPKFFLSNGTKISAAVIINTDAANVSNVNYVLHAPKGLKVDRIAFTGLLPETAQVVFDQPAGKGWLDIVVTTRISGVTVTASGQLNSGSIKTVSGLNGQHLIITLP